jgi:sugar transferase EpsL
VLEASIAVVALAVLAPVLVVVAALLRLRLGQVLFTQQRAGHNGRPFTLHKFCTMTGGRGPDGALLPDEQRLTKLGRFLRSTSLDELPELWNVVRGEMSFVGPRPLPVAYLPRYTAEEARRHGVSPGITGWAQVNGRNAVDWDERLAMDVWYVDHRTVLLDLRIIARTFGTVLRRDGVSAEGVATMTELRPHLAAKEQP